MKNLTDPEKKYSVLIADDNQNNLKVLSSMLEGLNYRVRVANSGEQALQSVVSLKPDIILLDIHMPGMDGYEVCSKLKEMQEFREIPVIFISALSEVFNKIQAFRAGGVDYITKPFELEEVRLRVETHIQLRENTAILEKIISDLHKKEEMLIQSEKMAALGVLTAGITHEINNPVNFISNSFFALEDRINNICSEKRPPDDEMIDDFKKLLANISIGIGQITKIISSLRLYSRSEADRMIDANLNELIDSALVIMHHRLAGRIAVEKQFTPLPLIKCQPGKINQVFINVIANSVDAIEDSIRSGIIPEDNGKINITTEAREGYIYIKISDNGSGIEESLVSKVFDPFFTTKEVGQGTGLGLSICRTIINDHNGSIVIESTGKNGTSIIIKIHEAEKVHGQ